LVSTWKWPYHLLRFLMSITNSLKNIRWHELLSARHTVA
jgi:hypothetical protein